MTKKFSNLRCVHCLKLFEELTADHVFPKSWYPVTTPENIEKWQMPSCGACNNKYGKIEEELGLKFGLCLDPTDHNAIGIANKAMRSINPLHAKNDRDFVHRKKRREKVIREVIKATTAPISAIFPNFGFHPHVDPNEELAILIPKEGLTAIGEKIIRGITWVIDRQYIEQNYEISIFFLRQESEGPILKPILKFGNGYSCGPGILIRRAVCDNDHITGLYLIEIWGKLKMYGTVTPLKT